jgi:hypothetical protein
MLRRIRPAKALVCGLTAATSMVWSPSSSSEPLAQQLPRLPRCWVLVPAGTMLILAALWGLDSVIRLTGIAFPASVAAMLLPFFDLIALEAAVGGRKIKRIVGAVDIPVGAPCEPGRRCPGLTGCGAVIGGLRS